MAVYRVVRVDELACRITLARDSEGGELVLEGVVLDAQSALENGQTVLWVTEGSPFEEGLHIYLIGRDGALLDAIEAGAPYSPGILELLSASQRTIEFRFFKTDAVYALDIAPAARVRWFLPNGFKYKRALSRHFLSVTKRPGKADLGKS